jgi:chaperonin GroES
MSKSTKKIVPLGDRVLLRLTEPAKNVGRILIPDQYQKKPQSGEVLAVGPDCKEIVGADRMESDNQYRKRIKAGVVVIFNQYGGTVCPDDDTLLLIREDELLGVYETC